MPRQKYAPPLSGSQRIASSLFIGYATQQPADVLIWSLHRDPVNNGAHEFPLLTTVGCDIAGGVGTCTRQGLITNGADIFKIRHDVDFIVGADGRLNPCADLLADPRMGTGFCPRGAFNTREMLGILSPIPHEIQARTGKKFASLQPGGTPLVSIDVSGNEATNGQYLFPFGVNLGGIAFPEMNEIDLNQMNKPFRFSGIPWNLDRRLSPGGCIDTTGPTGVPDGIPDCETTAQPLDLGLPRGTGPADCANPGNGAVEGRARPLPDQGGKSSAGPLVGRQGEAGRK